MHGSSAGCSTTLFLAAVCHSGDVVLVEIVGGCSGDGGRSLSRTRKPWPGCGRRQDTLDQLPTVRGRTHREQQVLWEDSLTRVGSMVDLGGGSGLAVAERSAQDNTCEVDDGLAVLMGPAKRHLGLLLPSS